MAFSAASKLATRKVSQAVFARRASEVPAEKAAERSDAFEADFQADVGDALLPTFQHAPGVVQALSLQILVWRLAKDLAKQPVKMIRRKTGFPGDFS